MVAIGGGMGHVEDQELRHGQIASIVTEKSDEDLGGRQSTRIDAAHMIDLRSCRATAGSSSHAAISPLERRGSDQENC
jgi:hypothetical protein